MSAPNEPLHESEIRLLISGGPGSGCTSTAKVVGERLGLAVFDSDAFFHKPTDPPFQEAYAPEERCAILGAALGAETSWVLAGSVATWGLKSLAPTHGVFLEIPRDTRLRRLMERQRQQFGARIDPGGDMHGEHESFMEWAAGYEGRTEVGRNLRTDRAFLQGCGGRFLVLTEDEGMEKVATRIVEFLGETR